MGRVLIAIAITFQSVSCAPPGMPSRLIQQPYQAENDEKLELAGTVKPIMERGLPDSCNTTPRNSKENHCITCEVAPPILRCLKSPTQIKPEIHCRYNQRKIKCLAGKSVISVNLERPQEKIFQKQMIMLIDTIRVITNDKMEDKASKKRLDAILNIISMNSDNLFKEDLANEIANSLAELAGENKYGEILQIVKELNQLRISGKLAAESSKTFFVDLLMLFPDLTAAQKVIEGLSLQGLESVDSSP